MKSILFSILAISILSLSSCSKVEVNEEVPNCIEKKIQNILNEPVQNPAAKVWKWEDDQDTYYYFTSDCCDQYNYLYDNKCKLVCAPDGGFTGNGDGNCPSFQGTVVQTLVWEDPRG